VLVAPAGIEDDRGGVIQGVGELQEFQVVGLCEPGDVVQVVLAGDGDDGARQWPGRQCLGPVGKAGQPGGVEGHRVLLVRRVTRNDLRYGQAIIPALAEPTPDQRRAFHLIGAGIPLTLNIT
jgi:hypothetical protein